MPVQYLYPKGDYDANTLGVIRNPSNFHSPLWPYVDEGVSNASVDTDDYNYGYLSVNPVRFGYVTDPVTVGPDDSSSVRLNIRCIAVGSGVTVPALSYGYYSFDESGKPFRMMGSADLTLVAESYQNFSVPLDSLSHSGNLNNQLFRSLNSGIIYFEGIHSNDYGYNYFGISAVEIVVSGNNIFQPQNYVDLFVQGPQPFNQEVTLFINGVIPTGLSDSIPLYTLGSAPVSGGIDLFCQSSDHVNNCDMYIAGHLPANNSIDLSIIGGYTSGNIPLSILSIPPESIDGQLNFNIFATLDSGVYGITDLYTVNAGTSNAMPIVIKADSSADHVSYIPVFVKNDNTSNSFVPLVINNQIQSTDNSVKFRIGGLGQNEGWNVNSQSMPLFINRPYDTDGNGITFYTNTPSGTFDSLPISISGGYVVTDGIDLATPVVIGPIGKQMPIVSHGF